MILSFTQEYKKQIELLGMTVIEYKRMVYKLTNIWERAYRWLNKVRETVIKIADEVWDVAKRITELCDSLQDLIEIHTPAMSVEKYKPVLIYMKCNKPYKGARRIDKRCRSRC